MWRRESGALRDLFGVDTRRLTLDACLPCPNRDGTCGTGGCVFCDNASFSPAVPVRHRTITHQLDLQIARHERSGSSDAAFLAYFQAGTNTHGPIDQLRALWTEAIAHPRVRGLVIGTRPDALGPDVLALLTEIAGRTRLFLELGLQSVRDDSLRWMNRGHDAAAFFDAVTRCRAALFDRVNIGVHIVLGFPGDTPAHAADTARALSKTGIDAVKVHNLHVVRNTPLEAQWNRGEVSVPTRDEYLAMVVSFLVALDPRVVVQRLVADAPDETLLAPDWMRPARGGKSSFLLDVERALRSTGQRQGSAITESVPRSEGS